MGGNEKAAGVLDAPQAAHKETDTPDFIAASAESKAFATLRARAALAGFTLVRLDDGTLLLSRWGWSATFPDMQVVHEHLQRIGGAA